MKKTLWIVVPIAVVAGAWFAYSRVSAGAEEVEYRYAPVAKGEIVRSISATGMLVPLTKVDVKSKAGGRIVKLHVLEGSVVKQGDLIATIDPSDTRAVYDQAAADVKTAQARASQARYNYQLEQAGSKNSIADAQSNLLAAKTRLARIELEYKRQPVLSESSLRSAEAAKEAAVQELQRFEEVTAPQTQRDSETSLRRAVTALEAAEADMRRQEELLEQGYVSLSAVERARTTLASARADKSQAEQRASTLAADLQATRRSRQLALEQAEANLETARANQSQVEISGRNVEEARTGVVQAELALQNAKDQVVQVLVRQNDIVAAESGAVRSNVSLDNAKVQLDSTTVLAPRDGVVTLKYLEEGTIIPPGTSTFAQGTSLVELSDTTQMFVECAVDEADFGVVKLGQNVRVVVEAYPGARVKGVVERINPAAQTEQNITAVKVRVKVLPGVDVPLLPGMSATCEFITLALEDRLVAPSQAIQREGDKTYVKVRSSDPLKPIFREVEVGESGIDGIEIISGLKEGEEVVVAEINLVEMRETQRRMMEAQQGGGLAGGPTGGRRPTTTGGAGGARGGAAGGARPGGTR